MQKEASTAPSIVATQLTENINVMKELVSFLRKKPPSFVYTIARGSSDHAAYFAKYLFSTQAGLITASLPPSINSIYHSKLKVKNALAIAISQSGASPDVCSSLQAAKEAHATTVAIVNNTDSMLAQIADFVIPMHAGIENAVAATKTYIASLTVIIQLIAFYSNDKSLLESLPKLPLILEEANQCQWDQTVAELTEAINLIVIARGISYPIAQEAALKFKETANIHAEAFSAAEFQHGPMALAKPDFPLLFFAQHDAALPSLLALSSKMTRLGANTMLACANNDMITRETAKHLLRLPDSLNPIFDPVVTIQAFYPMMAQLALARGFDPDTHENLKKITETH